MILGLAHCATLVHQAGTMQSWLMSGVPSAFTCLLAAVQAQQQ